MFSFINRIQPDVDDLLLSLTPGSKPKRLHSIEIFLDQEIKDQVQLRCFGRDPSDLETREQRLSAEIELHMALGYDVFRLPVVRKGIFKLSNRSSDQKNSSRAWAEEKKGVIQNWEDFEKYSWPQVKDIDLRDFEWMEKNLPGNMGCYDLTAHIYEVISFLFGYESLCLFLYDEPDLVTAVCGKVGRFYADYTEILAQMDKVPFLWGADDLGFRSGLLMPRDFIVNNILPWHKKCADAAHAAGKPYILHSCGNIREIMDDLIDDVGIDGKHSFEDAIQPVEEAFAVYGSRTAVLGGLDVDILTRAPEQEIRRKTRDILDACFRGSGYIFGTGNSVAAYVPLENYCAMMDEASRYSREITR